MSGGSLTLTPVARPPVVWLDVEDLFEYARHSPRPSGIQRLAFEIYQALHGARGDAGVRFLRHVGEGFSVVEWPEVAALFGSLAACAPDGDAPAAPEASPAPVRERRGLMRRLPPSLQDHVSNVAGAQRGAATASRHAIRAWWGLFDAVGRGVLRAPLRLRGRRPPAPVPEPPAPPPDAQPSAFEAMAQPGDVLLVLGSPWSHAGYGALVRDVKERLGLRFALLVYDLIPLRRPEWCDAGLVRMFRDWFDDVFPLCDAVFAISRATADDVTRYAAERGLRLPGPVQPIPIGSGFAGGGSGLAGDIPASPAPRSARLPAPGSYALIVSTIEARKNHLLLFRIWRRLLEAHPADSVPTLVFAGRVGWLVDDLMRQITNTQSLGGKLVLVENPSDAELAALYQGCQFTLFPSFYEGWGLPVTESLAFGKPCLIADRTSLPEAGGTLARSFDPDNLHDAYAAVEAVVTDPAGLAEWEARVRREFRPVPWSETAASLLAGLPGQARP